MSQNYAFDIDIPDGSSIDTSYEMHRDELAYLEEEFLRNPIHSQGRSHDGPNFRPSVSIFNNKSGQVEDPNPYSEDEIEYQYYQHNKKTHRHQDKDSDSEREKRSIIGGNYKQSDSRGLAGSERFDKEELSEHFGQTPTSGSSRQILMYGSSNDPMMHIDGETKTSLQRPHPRDDAGATSRPKIFKKEGIISTPIISSSRDYLHTTNVQAYIAGAGECSSRTTLNEFRPETNVRRRSEGKMESIEDSLKVNPNSYQQDPSQKESNLDEWNRKYFEGRKLRQSTQTSLGKERNPPRLSGNDEQLKNQVCRLSQEAEKRTEDKSRDLENRLREFNLKKMKNSGSLANAILLTKEDREETSISQADILALLLKNLITRAEHFQESEKSTRKNGVSIKDLISLLEEVIEKSVHLSQIISITLKSNNQDKLLNLHLQVMNFIKSPEKNHDFEWANPDQLRDIADWYFQYKAMLMEMEDVQRRIDGITEPLGTFLRRYPGSVDTNLVNLDEISTPGNTSSKKMAMVSRPGLTRRSVTHEVKVPKYPGHVPSSGNNRKGSYAEPLEVYSDDDDYGEYRKANVVSLKNNQMNGYFLQKGTKPQTSISSPEADQPISEQRVTNSIIKQFGWTEAMEYVSS